MSLLELMIAMVFLLVALQGFAAVISSTGRTSATSFEVAQAKEAARRVVETIQSEDFARVFALYNANPADDPGGAGTAPGAGFAVEGLALLDNDADGLVGQVVLPTTMVAGVEELREDSTERRLGMPRDLTGDGVADGLDHSGDYRLLPVLVRVSWRSKSGPAKVEFKTILANY